MEIRTETISPGLARSYLARIGTNRPVSKVHVSRLSDDMRNGRWIQNGDSIRFSDGKLIDGQHRLHAVIASGVSIPFVVINGLGNDAFEVIDSGKPRHVSDVLFILGEKSVRDLASAVRWIVRSESRDYGDAVKASNKLVLETLERHPGIRAYVSRVASLDKSGLLLPRSHAAAFWYLFAKRDDELAERLFDYLRVETDSTFASGHPFRALKSRLFNWYRLNVRTWNREYAGVMIKAWNSARVGESMKLIRFSSEEEVPEIK